MSRIQFAVTVSFHFIYPPISMGLGLLMVVIARRYVRTKDPVWRQSSLGVLAFGLAGLGYSTLLPLMIGFGQKELRAVAASVAGGLIAFHQMGYGIAAFGVGPLEERTGLGLSEVYGVAAVVALAMAVVSFVVVPRHDQPSSDATPGYATDRGTS